MSAVAEASTAIGAVELVDGMPGDVLDLLDDELGDAVTTADREVLVRVGVDQDDLQLVAVPAVDQARGVRRGDAVTKGVAAARQHEPGVAEGDRHGDPGGHQGPAPTGIEHHVDRRSQVEPGVTLMGVVGQLELVVEADHRDTQHDCRAYRRDELANILPRVGPSRPPSIDALARAMHGSGLPHALCVRAAREMVAAGEATLAGAPQAAAMLRRRLLTEVINATGVLLHTNLGRAPRPPGDSSWRARGINLEFDVTTGRRGSRYDVVGTLFAELCATEAALVVNNNAAAVLLAVAATAGGREVLVSRGESVEIGGGFRVPEVITAGGARLVDVGTTNRTRLADYRAALFRPGADVAAVLKVHPSNFRVVGFTETTPVDQLAGLGVPVLVDIGSGLLDAGCPWLDGPPPIWLSGEPAARQTLAAGATLVTFSGDKLLGGPQAGILAGTSEAIARCAAHPLARAVRPGRVILADLQAVALSYLCRRAAQDVPFWVMATRPVAELRARAEALAGAAWSAHPTLAVAGAGSLPGASIPSFGISAEGDRLSALRAHDPPIVGRQEDGRSVLDLRAVDPADDGILAAALAR
jgi:L-seryl-tRNA(Ser) seleniumtransferase